MFQREVALRLTAAPRTKAYGRLSVLTQWLAEPRILFDVPARAFTPPPKVISSLVGIVPAPCTAGSGRKTRPRTRHRRRLRPAPQDAALEPRNCSASPVIPLLDRAGVPPTARAEELTVAQFCALARAIEDG